jgi:hypothetical protein
LNPRFATRIDHTVTFAKKNLRAVEDSALKFGLSETQEARFLVTTWEQRKPGSTSYT